MCVHMLCHQFTHGNVGNLSDAETDHCFISWLILSTQIGFGLSHRLPPENATGDARD